MPKEDFTAYVAKWRLACIKSKDAAAKNVTQGMRVEATVITEIIFYCGGSRPLTDRRLNQPWSGEGARKEGSHFARPTREMDRFVEGVWYSLVKNNMHQRRCAG